jgi:3-oxoacyl-[acyl-carrier-protein] synthase II
LTPASPPRPIAITGAGLVTALGADVDTTWRALLAGHSGIRRITSFDARGLATQIAGELELAADGPGAPDSLLGRPAHTRREQVAFRALAEALRAAGLARSALSGTRTGLFTGCENTPVVDYGLFAAYDALAADATACDALAARHHRDLMPRKPDAILRALAALVPGAIVRSNFAMACAAGAVAASEALRWLRRGVIDRAIVIAADTPIDPGNVYGFGQLGALSAHNEHPTRASRPFDAQRSGFVLAEGAGALVLEARELARARGAAPLGWLTGAGMSNNQSHITNTPRSGEHAARAMQAALDDAGLTAADIGYINAHGTSTDVGDAGETAAIQRVFAAPPPVSSTKSMTGHLVAAAGIIEAIVTALAVRDGWLPPTINQDEADPECPLDYVANRARAAQLAHAMTNSFGFGGTNVSLVISKDAR